MSPRTPKTSDLVYAITWAGAIGSSVTAIFFLGLDILAGQPLATPLLIASALFTGELPAAGDALRLDFVALYSLVHLAAFAVAGGLFAVVASRLRGHPAFRILLTAGVFATLTVGAFALDVLVGPELVSSIGLVSLTIGNLIAAAAMTFFYARVFHEVDAGWELPTTLIGDSN